MYYEIVSFDKRYGSMQVRFWTDDYPAGLTYSIDVPIENGEFVAGAALDAHILSFAPHGQIARLVAAQLAPSDALDALVKTVGTDKGGEVSVEVAIEVALLQIDQKAAEVRARFVTLDGGQTTIYVIKAQQAQAYKDAGYTGTVPPYIAACAEADGKTAQETADEILYLQNLWVNVIDPKIEGARLAGKKAVRSATDATEAKVARILAVDALDSIKPSAS